MANEYLDHVQSELPIKHILFLDAFLVSMDIEQTLEQVEAFNISADQAEQILNHPVVVDIVQQELKYRLTALRASEARTTVNVMDIAYNTNQLAKDRLKALQLLYQYKHVPAKKESEKEEESTNGVVSIAELMEIGKKMQGASKGE